MLFFICFIEVCVLSVFYGGRDFAWVVFVDFYVYFGLFVFVISAVGRIRKWVLRCLFSAYAFCVSFFLLVERIMKYEVMVFFLFLIKWYGTCKGLGCSFYKYVIFYKISRFGRLEWVFFVGLEEVIITLSGGLWVGGFWELRVNFDR